MPGASRPVALVREDVREHQTVQAQHDQRALDVADRPLAVRQPVATISRREFGLWLTAESAAAFLDYPDTRAGVKAFREWARRAKVPTAHRGRRVLFARRDLLEAIGAAHRAAHVLRG